MVEYLLTTNIEMFNTSTELFNKKKNFLFIFIKEHEIHLEIKQLLLETPFWLATAPEIHLGNMFKIATRIYEYQDVFITPVLTVPFLCMM